MRRAIPIVAIALVVSACAVSTQKTAIRDARLGLAISGVAVEAADQAAVEVFVEYDAEDTEKYCQGEITLYILDQVAIALQGARDAIRLWETSLATYLVKKDGGSETETVWSEVLGCEQEWFNVLADVIAVLDMGIQYMKHAGVKMPGPLEFAWSWLYGLTGKEQHDPPDLTWGDLADGVCAPYLPGGGS